MEEPTKEPQSFTKENSGNDFVLTSTEEQKLANHVHRTYVSADSGRTSWVNKKNEGLKLYFGLLTSKTFPFKNCSNVNVPVIKTLKETLHSNLHGSFDIRNPFDVLPIGSEDIQKAAKIRKFLNWQFTNEINFNSLLDSVLDFCLVYGHAVVKCRYSQETRIRKEPVTGPPSAEVLAVQANELPVEEKEEVTFDGVKVDVLNTEHVLFPIDEITSDTNLMDHVIHEIIMSSSDIRRRIASGEYRDIDLGKPQTVGENEAETTLRDTRDRYIGLN